jgi:predicted house-cleaning noncanonical NTP pyrophosphatase (MazG superfamily)
MIEEKEFDDLPDLPELIDKIFQNKYDETELDSGDFNFAIDPSFQEKSYENTIDEVLIRTKIEELIATTNQFERFQFPDDKGNFKKMSKSDINEIYSFVTSNLSKEPKIEIYSILCSIFDINSEKFYESLSNTFKTELINSLKGRGYLKNRKSLF